MSFCKDNCTVCIFAHFVKCVNNVAFLISFHYFSLNATKGYGEVKIIIVMIRLLLKMLIESVIRC